MVNRQKGITPLWEATLSTLSDKVELRAVLECERCGRIEQHKGHCGDPVADHLALRLARIGWLVKNGNVLCDCCERKGHDDSQQQKESETD